MSDLKEIVNGTQEKVLQETIDATTLYNITDLFEIVTATNATMTQEYMESGFYKKDAYVLCTDDGTYTKGMLYKFGGFSFIPFASIPEVVKAISALSTDAQVPSAKLLYDKLVELQSLYAPKSSVQISDGGELNGIVRDMASNIFQGTINKDKAYSITDLDSISMNNAQMINALLPAQEGLIKPNSIRFCTDNGTYEKDNFYQFTVNYVTGTASWVKVEMGYSIITETTTLAPTDWTALSSSDPYTYQATITATATIGANSIVELFNDNAVTFATYGFAIGSVSGQNITIYSIGQPSVSVDLTIGIGG